MHQSHLRYVHAKKSSREITTHSHLYWHSVVAAARGLKECLVAKPERLQHREPSRSFSPSIMRDGLQRRTLAEARLKRDQGAQPWPIRMML